MKCSKCGNLLPEDSEFCQYCGAKLDSSASDDVSFTVSSRNEASFVLEAKSDFTPGHVLNEQQQTEPETSPPADCHSTETPVAVPVAVSPQESELNNKKQRRCKKCGAAIDPITKKCSSCGNKYFRAKTAVPLILSTVLLLFSVGLNIVQYVQSRGTIKTLTASISSLNTEIDTLKEKNSSLSTTVDAQKKQIASFSLKADYFDKICKELDTGCLGYASKNFNASESIIAVSKYQTNRKFTLTAYWNSGGTVYVDYSGNSAYVSFDNDTWYPSTTLIVCPRSAGITVVTFSNSVDSTTFKVLIIVTD